jgi:hypothetical protein
MNNEQNFAVCILISNLWAIAGKNEMALAWVAAAVVYGYLRFKQGK